MVLHSFLICFVAMALGANLGLIFMLSHPFDSDWAIQPKSFEVNSRLIRKYGEIQDESDTSKRHQNPSE